MNNAKICELDKLVEQGIMTKRIDESDVYFMENGEISKKKVENCTIYETATGSSKIVYTK
jgi:hypothetical protein